MLTQGQMTALRYVNTERPRIVALASSDDNIMCEDYENRIFYTQIRDSFPVNGDHALDENEYRAAVLMVNGQIVASLKVNEVSCNFPDSRLPEKFLKLDQLIAFSAQLNRSDAFERFQHYARGLIYQRIGDYMLLSQKNRKVSELQLKKVCAAFAAYTLAVEHLSLVDLSKKDMLSSATALAWLEIERLTTLNMALVDSSLREVIKQRDDQTLGSRLLKIVLQDGEPLQNSFILSDTASRRGCFNGVIPCDKPLLASVMWNAVGKFDFHRRIVWLFMNDQFYAASYYSFADEWMNQKKMPDVFEGHFQCSRDFTKVEVKMFLFGMTVWTQVWQRIHDIKFQKLNSFLYPFYHVMPGDSIKRFYNALIKSPTGVIMEMDKTYHTDGMFLVKGLDSLHLRRANNFDRRIHNEMMMYVATCMDLQLIPMDRGFSILETYAECILENLKEDPKCEIVKAVQAKVKPVTCDVMCYIEAMPPSAEDDAKITSNANFMMARVHNNMDDWIRAEEYVLKADEKYNPGLGSWLNNLRDAWCTADLEQAKKDRLAKHTKRCLEIAAEANRLIPRSTPKLKKKKQTKQRKPKQPEEDESFTFVTPQTSRRVPEQQRQEDPDESFHSAEETLSPRTPKASQHQKSKSPPRSPSPTQRSGSSTDPASAGSGSPPSSPSRNASGLKLSPTWPSQKIKEALRVDRLSDSPDSPHSYHSRSSDNISIPGFPREGPPSRSYRAWGEPSAEDPPVLPEEEDFVDEPPAPEEEGEDSVDDDDEEIGSTDEDERRERRTIEDLRYERQCLARERKGIIAEAEQFAHRILARENENRIYMGLSINKQVQLNKVHIEQLQAALLAVQQQQVQQVQSEEQKEEEAKQREAFELGELLMKAQIDAIDNAEPEMQRTLATAERTRQIFRNARPVGEILEEGKRKTAEEEKKRLVETFQFQQMLNQQFEAGNRENMATLARIELLAHSHALQHQRQRQISEYEFQLALQAAMAAQQQQSLLAAIPQMQFNIPDVLPQLVPEAQQEPSSSGVNVVSQGTSTPCKSAKQKPQFPPGPPKLEDDEDEYEIDRFECVKVKQFVGSFGESGQLYDNFDPLGYGPLVLLYSEALNRHRLTFAESNAVNLLVGPNFVHRVSRSRRSVVVDAEDYSDGSRRGERLIVNFQNDEAGEVETQRFASVISQIVSSYREDHSQDSGSDGGSS